MIPDATAADYERDAEADYVYDPNSLGYCSWIRRAVAAEKENDRLEAKLDETYRMLLATVEQLKDGNTQSSSRAP